MPLVKTLKFKQRLAASLLMFAFFIVLFIFFAGWNKTSIHCLRSFINQPGMSAKKSFKPFQKTDNFNDIARYLQKYRDSDNSVALEPFEKIIIRTLPYPDNPTLADMMGIEIRPNATSLDKFQYSISQHDVYRESDPLIPILLQDIATLPIESVERKIYGTQLKLTIKFSNGILALFKPERFTRDTETLDDHFYFQDFERHNSEIAAFHLDRALNFRRTIPTVGRRINMTSEIRDIASDEIKNTFFISPANNVCFWGNCTYYCSFLEPVCGQPDMLEGSFAAFLPQFDEGYVWEHVSPWKRTYSFYKRAPWENDTNYCAEVRTQPLYLHDNGRKLLDLMDMAVFDFLTGNLDRHHYEYFTIWNNDSTSIYLDNGRGFGKPFYDDYSILMPIIHCCLIRESTLITLMRFHNGPKPLSQIMRESLADDPIAPVLWEPHLIAFDRRVQIILEEIRKCLQKI